MKKVLQILGSIVYALITSYLMWLFFYWITPTAMSVGWWAILAYFAGSFIIMGILVGLSTVIALPIIYLTKDNKISKWVMLPFFIFYGYSSIMLPYRLNGTFNVSQWITAICLSLTALVTFAAFIRIIFKSEDFRE